MGKKKNGEDLQNTPVLEIKPSEEYQPRPMWQRIAAWIIIALIVAATGIIGLWGNFG